MTSSAYIARIPWHLPPTPWRMPASAASKDFVASTYAKCSATAREPARLKGISHEQGDQLTKSHAKDILAHYPDGHTTRGIDAHIEELKPMFVFAPDTRIKEHPVRIASNEWTAVSGFVEGTFTRPMPIGPGKTIPPTNKS